MVLYSELLIKVLTAFLMLIIGLILSQIISNITRKFLRGAEVNKIIEQQLKLKIGLENYISSIIKYLIYLITIILVLNELGVSTKILQIVLVIVIILIAIFIILAFRDWLPNLISGLYLIRTEKIKPKDTIKIKGLRGRVIKINLLETKIETVNNEIIFIPNSNLTKFEMIKEKK